MNITTATPTEIDNAWFPHMARTQRAIDNYERAIHKNFNQATINKLAVAVTEAEAAEAPYRAEWEARGGWDRYYLVQNNNGHVHTSTACSTCYFDTRFVVLANLSGKTGPEIIDAIGTSACTVCFPGAPVDRPRSVFTADEVKDNAAKEADRAARKAKADAKAAKAITMPDGSALRNEWGVVKTERMAEINAVDALFNDALYRFTHPSRDEWLAYVERAVVALAAKRGTDEAAQRAIIEAKAAKKIKKEL